MTPPWFDRCESLELLSRRVAGFRAGYRQNLSLLGPEGAGKTTLLKRLLHEARRAGKPPLICAYLEVAEEDTLAEWASRFIQTLLYAALQTQQSDHPPAHLQELMRSAEASVPKTAAAASKLLALAEAGKSDEAYDCLWDLPQLLFQETGHRTVLVLDEFHRLNRIPIREPFRSLGRKIMVQGSTMYILGSSQPALARSILREGLALLFGQFEILELGSLSESSCLRAIHSLWPEAEANPSLIHLLMQLAQGHSQRLDLLLRCLQAVSFQKFQEDPLGRVLELLEILLLDPSSSLRKEFESRLRSLRSDRNRLFTVHVLAVMASGVHRKNEIAQTLGRPVSQVAQALRILEEKQWVVRQGVFTQIPDRFFRLWMVAAYPLLHGVGWTDSDQVTACFRKAAQTWVQGLLQPVRPLKDRMLELVRRWDHEQVALDGKRMLLPRFSEVSYTEGIKGHGALSARGRGGRFAARWWILLWEGSLEENEARAFVQAVQSHPAYKTFRKVIVGPASPVDVNARLILQQGRIRLWDLQILNQLLDLYGLPAVPAHLPSQDLRSGEVAPMNGRAQASPADTFLSAEKAG